MLLVALATTDYHRYKENKMGAPIHFLKKGRKSDFNRNDLDGFFCDFFYGFFNWFSC
jgi:hypothetical protein